MGRAEKYANVVDDYEKEQKALEKKKKKKIDKEEELSMTRELKFQEIQKKLDDTVTIGDAEELAKLEDETFDVDNTSEIEVEENVLANTDTLEIDTIEEVEETSEEEDPKKEEPKKEAPKKEAPKKEKIPELVSSKEMRKAKDEIEDDLYITSSLKPLRKRFKMKKVFKVLFTWLLIALGIIALYFFGFKPLYNYLVNSKPRKVFENSIHYVNQKIKEEFEGIKFDDKVLFTDLNFKINSNLDDLDGISQYYLGFSYGADPVNRKYQETRYIRINGSTYGDQYIEVDGKAYEHLIPMENYISLGNVEDISEDDEFYNEVGEDLKYLSDFFNQDNLYYFLDKQEEILLSLFEDGMFSKSSDEMDINGKTVKATRNTLKLNAVDYKRLHTKYIESILEDDKLVSIMAKFSNETVEEIRKELAEALKEEVKEDYELVFNIYTSITNKVLGFDISEEGFRIAYVYTKDKNYAIHLNLTEDEDCKEGKDCVVTNQEIIDITGEDKGTYTEAIIKYNSNTVAKLNLRSFDEKIDFDYELYIEGETYSGDCLVFTNKEEMSATADFSVKLKDNKYVDVKGEYVSRAPSNFAYVNFDKIISESKFDSELEDFKKSIGDNTVFNVLSFWIESLDDPTSIVSEEKTSNA